MLKRIPTARPNETVAEAKERLLDPSAAWDAVNYVYILDSKNHLTGVASIKELLGSKPNGLMGQFEKNGKRAMTMVHPHSQLPVVAARAIVGGVKALPVVDTNNVFLGIIGTDTILKTLEHEHVRSLLSLSGWHSHITFLDVITARITKVIMWRTPWLVAGLFGGMVATGIVGAFEKGLTQVIELAFFMPIIVYMASAVGTQTQTIFIRNLAIEKVRIRTYAIRELIVDVVIGITAALIIFPFAWLVTGATAIAFVVSLALLLVILIAGAVALTIPLILMRFKLDPSVGSGPFTTIIQDILSLIIYFTVATVFLL